MKTGFLSSVHYRPVARNFCKEGQRSSTEGHYLLVASAPGRTLQPRGSPGVRVPKKLFLMLTQIFLKTQMPV